MPLYEFYCRRCKQQFEAEQHIEEHERQAPDCPRCAKSEEVDRLVSPVYAKTASKS